jgi:DNA-binding protein HU-beta
VYYTQDGLTTRKPLSSIGFRPNTGAGGFVIKLDIVNAIVAKTNIPRTKAEQALETVFEAMKDALGRGERIELRRFGVFNVKPRKTGIGRNPRTGQQVSIPPGKAVRFKPGKELQAIPAAVAKS